MTEYRSPLSDEEWASMSEHLIVNTVRRASGKPVSARCSCGEEFEGASSFARIEQHIEEVDPEEF